MFRTSAHRALVGATTSIAIIGLLLGLTGTALAADNRVVYFGDPATVNANPSGDRKLALSPVTAGGAFKFDVLVRNIDNQSLSHAFVGLGSQVTTRAGWDNASKPSLPPGSTVLEASASRGTCAITASKDGALCDVGKLSSGAEVVATFIVQAPSSATSSWVYASLRVAENNPQRGSNNNSFFADSAIDIGATTSDSNSTYKLSNQALNLTTKGLGGVSNDKMTTTVAVPDGRGGLISIVEKNGPTGCPNTACIGQEVQLNVRNGQELDPYLEWKLEIKGEGAGSNKGGILHTDDNGNVIENIRFTNANKCSASKPTGCIVSYVVNKHAGTTVIVFRTDTNGRVKAN